MILCAGLFCVPQQVVVEANTPYGCLVEAQQHIPKLINNVRSRYLDVRDDWHVQRFGCDNKKVANADG